MTAPDLSHAIAQLEASVACDWGYRWTRGRRPARDEQTFAEIRSCVAALRVLRVAQEKYDHAERRAEEYERSMEELAHDNPKGW